MAPRKPATPAKADQGQYLKVGDVVEFEGNGICVLPDGGAVTCRQRYTFQHEGLHVIQLADRPDESLEYLVEKK